MLTSTTFGGLPGLSGLWDHGPIWAAVIVLVTDVGIMWLLMLAEGVPPWRRQQYLTVVWNDTFFYPLYAAMTVVVLQGSGPLHGFYCSRVWHVGLLVVGLALSVGLEYLGLKVGQYTISQELSPSKLWHTLIFGIMFYWLISALIPVMVVHRPAWAIAVIAICFIGTITTMIIEVASPFPHDAHLEGQYIPWRWHIRTSPGPLAFGRKKNTAGR